jgi:2-dehydropantoate 2-reductase
MTSASKMRVLVIGAGAIGTYIGGSLALRGHDIVFLEHPETAAQLREQGVYLQIESQEHHLPLPQVHGNLEDALEAGPFELAIYALKSFDTKNALAGMVSHKTTLPPFLCLSNGVDNEMEIGNTVGVDKVIAGTITSAIGRRDIGNIVLERLRGVGVAAGHPLSVRITEVLEEAGLNARLYPQAEDMKWSKLLTNLLANATSAILDMSPAGIFAHPGLYRLEMAQLRETLGVMQGEGIAVVDLPGTPVRLLAAAVRFLPDFASRPLIGRAVGAGRGAKMPSFHIDLHSGRGISEVDYLNGAVIRAGARLGFPTPVNRFLNKTLLGLTNGEIPMEAFRHKPEEFIAAVQGAA